MHVHAHAHMHAHTHRHRVTLPKESLESRGSWAGVMLAAEEVSVHVPKVEAMH